MSQMITPTQINFNELVKNSNTTMSLNLQNKLVVKLNENFNEDEQKWYVANLYMYMNYHPTNEYSINLDNVYKLIGFANKGNAKRLLKNHFKENVDYTLTVIRSDNGKFANETVMLNVNTFKKLCLKANTSKADEIHDYYVKLENIYNEIIKEELENNKKQYEFQQTQIKHLEEKNTIDKKLERHNVLLNILKYKKCIYLIEISENLIKIGSSYQIDKRRDSIKNTFGGDGIFLDIFECNEFRDVEQKILNDTLIKQYKYKDKLQTGHTSNEVVQLSDEFNYKQLVSIVEKYINENNTQIKLLSGNQLVEMERFKFLQNLVENGINIENVFKDTGLSEKEKLEQQKINLIENMMDNHGAKIDHIQNIFFTANQKIEYEKLIIIEKLIDTGSKPDDIIKILGNLKTIQNNKYIDDKLDKNIITIRQNNGKKIQQIDPGNLNRLVKVYDNMETLLKDRQYDTFSETGIRDAIKENRIYKKYRWMFVEDDQDPLVIRNIQENNPSKKAMCLIILELTSDKTKITRHFTTLNVAKTELKISIPTLKKIIKNQELYNNHYYIYKDDCAPDVLSLYDISQANYVPRGAIKVKAVHSETNEEKIFPSLKHAYDFCKIHHKTIHKVITEKRIYAGFYWYYVE